MRFEDKRRDALMTQIKTSHAAITSNWKSLDLLNIDSLQRVADVFDVLESAFLSRAEPLKFMDQVNGWTNGATWYASMWMDTDERDTMQDLTDHARSAYPDDRRAELLARDIRETIESNTPDLSDSLYLDAMNWAIGKINWVEIAESYLNEE